MSALWGLPPAAPRRWVERSRARAGMACPPDCRRGLRDTPVPATMNLVFDSADRLRGASWVGDAVPRSYEEGERIFMAWEAWISAALKAGPLRVPLPPRFFSVDAATRLEGIRAGRFALEAGWAAYDGWVRLRWSGRGAPTARVEISPQVCDAPILAQAAFALFPPTPAPDRAEAAARLAACQDTRATGALTEQAGTDPEESVRRTSVRSLGSLPGAGARDAVAAIASDARTPRSVRAEGVTVLAEVGDLTALRRLALDDQTPADIWAATARALEPTAARLDQETLRRLRPKRAHEIDALRAEREVAARRTAAGAESPPGRKAELAQTTPENDETDDGTKDDRSDAARAATDPSHEAMTAEPSPTPGRPEARPPPQSPALPHLTLARPRVLGPTDGTPLAIGAATVGGAALMRNLSRLGLDSTSSQVLLGSAGAIIGFGTAFGLARFGLRPDLSQAAWFTNVSAWGTLAGLTTWAALAGEDEKLRYGSLVIGELAGMIAGAATAKAYRWTPGQIVFADSLVLATGLGSAGFTRLTGRQPSYTPIALASVPVMTASALVAHNLTLTNDDVWLLASSALAGGWSGGLIASGASGSKGVLASRQGQGGALMGLGGGYLAATLAAPFAEVSRSNLDWALGGVVLGNMMGGGFAHLWVGARNDHDGGQLGDGEGERWKLGAGVGGVGLGLAAGALGPHLHPRRSAFGMSALGLTLGLSAPLFASWASAGGERTPAETAVRTGTLWFTPSLAATAGLVASRWWSPTAADEMTVLLTSALGATAGLGLARTLSPLGERGWRDTAGVYAGTAVGLGAGALFTHAHALTAPQVGGMVSGAAWGAFLGRLAPTLTLRDFQDDRGTSGGTWLGLGVTGAAGATLAGLTHATGAQVAVPTVAAAFGTGVGAGAGLMVSGTSSRPVRIGIFAGALGTAVASVATEPWLRLSQGLGPSAPSLGLTLGSLGAGYGLLLAGAIDPSGLVSETPERQRVGGLLLGGTAGLGTGLVLSRWLAPSPLDDATLWSASAFGASAAFGVMHLSRSEEDGATTWATLGGAGLGTLGSALFLRSHGLTTEAAEAGLLGAAWGAVAGRLAPAFTPAHDDARRRDGALALGASVGALGAATLAQNLGAQGGDLKVGAQASAWGLALGAGAGWLLSPGDDRGARAGAAATSLGAIAAGALLGRRLHLVDALPGGTAALPLSGAGIGVFDGLLVASLADPDGDPSDARLRGGALFGAAVGLGSGWLAAHLTSVPRPVLVSAWAATGLGALAGFGVGRLATTSEARHGQDAGALAGSLAGTTLALVAGRTHTPDAKDLPAAALGSALGGLTGALVPTLALARWDGGARRNQGGLALGLGAGAFAGTAARRLTDAEDRTLALITAGSADGLLTGLGAGLAITGDPRDASGSQPIRMGLLGGALGGALLGGLGSRLAWQENAGGAIAGAGLVAGWTGYWAGALGHARDLDIDPYRRAGIDLAATGGAILIASFATTELAVDPDLVRGALALEAVFSAAGGGVAATMSERADAIPAGVVAAGTGGLLLGGLLHERLKWSRAEAPQLLFGTAVGAWAGTLLPYLIKDADPVDSRAQAGGLLGGAAAGFGVASLLSVNGALTGEKTAILADATAAGAALGGGLGLLDENASPRLRAELAAGGTILGLGFGALAAPHVVPQRVAAGSALCLTLGTSEALLFAWSSNPGPSSGRRYGGAALAGAGIGTAFGIAGASLLHDDFTSIAPPAAGFGAWGGWIGAFGSAFQNRNRFTVTGGGVIGTDLGFAAGYALVRSGLVDSSDFGWLSLFAAGGTVLGAGVGAPLSSSTDPRPVLAGLALGPLVGMGVGAWALPRLRALRTRDARPPSQETDDADEGDPRGHAARAARRRVEETQGAQSSFQRRLAAVVEVTDWSPLVGALPAPTDASVPSPFLFGVLGHLR